MTKRTRRNRTPAFKANLVLVALRDDGFRTRPAASYLILALPGKARVAYLQSQASVQRVPSKAGPTS